MLLSTRRVAQQHRPMLTASLYTVARTTKVSKSKPLQRFPLFANRSRSVVPSAVRIRFFTTTDPVTPSKLKKAVASSSPISPVRPGTFEVMIYDKDGEFSRRRMSKTDLIRQTGLNARDLIVLDSGYHRRPRPVLLVRPTSFVVSLSYVRAIVMCDSVYLFHADQQKVQGFSIRFSEFLKGKRAPFLPQIYLDSSYGPLDMQDDDDYDSEITSENTNGTSAAHSAFELRALEGILSHICRQYHNRTMLLAPLVKSMLHTLSSKQVDPEILHQLLPMKDSISQFEIETTLMRNVLSELLHNEDDMLLMLLSETRANQGILPSRERHETVELLVENYCSQLIDIAQEAYYLRKSVESTQSIMELKLDTHRNYMLRINIQIAMGSMALALGTTLTGFFGANLTSGIEDHPTAFYWLGIVSASCVIGLYNVLKQKVERSIPRILEGESLDSIFNHLDEVQQILAVARSRLNTGSRHLSREELKAMLRKIAGVNINEEDLDIIYDTFDLNRDGRICENEVDEKVSLSRKEDHVKRITERFR